MERLLSLLLDIPSNIIEGVEEGKRVALPNLNEWRTCIRALDTGVLAISDGKLSVIASKAKELQAAFYQIFLLSDDTAASAMNVYVLPCSYKDI